MANPFDDDVDDAALRNPAYKPKTTGGGGGGYTNLKASSPEEDEMNFYERQIETIMQDSLASTGRSLRALEESEQIGVSTAENLLAQGEQLRKAEKNLDHIQNTTTQSQKHLNNIKSIFGGVKNYFSRTPSAKPSPSPSEDNFKSTTKLESTVTTLQTETVTYDRTGGPSSIGGSLPAASKQNLVGTRWGAMDDEIDDNLDLMAKNLSRLKNLGMGLQDEIDEQNKVIDRLSVKADKADIVIRDQDKQMKKIMGVKKPTTKAPEAETTDGKKK
jgi:synaptosomal-associated protein 29